MIKKIGTLFTMLLLVLAATACGAKKEMEDRIVYQENKILPPDLLEEVKTALSFFPELREVSIEFEYKEDTGKSLMQAQPDFNDFLKSKQNRSYKIYISSRFRPKEGKLPENEIAQDVLIGWLGHELGHIMDYRDKTALDMAVFGVKYVSSSKYLQKVEKTADVYAVNSGMADYILATKDFILNSQHLSDAYRERISRLYLSPEEIVMLVEQLDDQKNSETEKQPNQSSS